MEEAFLLRPTQALGQALARKQVRVGHGTKDGRPQKVSLDEVVQLEMLARAARLAASAAGTMIPRSYTLAR
ncbi:hypothetical protein [Pelomicrobium sp.]|uniref:hypothetical protein n=1 Tax=Pelomicrobium sp. TaxID=2815319 RepID=UPI002FDE672A